MPYVLSPKARADLDGVWDYTAERWDADQADRYVRQIAETVSRLADGTLPRRKADDVRAGYFRQPTGSHVIFYRQDPDGGIVVVRVLHQRMDPTLHA